MHAAKISAKTAGSNTKSLFFYPKCIAKISAFNVEFCLYGMVVRWYICPYITASSLASCALSVIMCACCPAPFYLLCQTSMSRSRTTLEWCWQRGRWGGRWLLRLGNKESQHCIAYTLLPSSHLPHNILHTPSEYRSIQRPTSAVSFSADLIIVSFHSQDLWNLAGVISRKSYKIVVVVVYTKQ